MHPRQAPASAPALAEYLVPFASKSSHSHDHCLLDFSNSPGLCSFAGLGTFCLLAFAAAPTHPPNTIDAPHTGHPPTPKLQGVGPKGAATIGMPEPAAKAEPEPEPEPEPAREPKSKSKPAGGSALLAALVKKHAPAVASKAVESSE